MEIKGKPVVQNNGYDGCIYVEPTGYRIELLQIGIEDKGGVVVEIKDRAQVRKEDIVELMALNQVHQVMPGTIMAGDIRVYRTHSPVDPEDPLLHIVYDDEGNVKMENGKYEWCYSEYSEDHLD